MSDASLFAANAQMDGLPHYSKGVVCHRRNTFADWAGSAHICKSL